MVKRTPDAFGDRMKEYERHETSERFLQLLPIYARLDGRGFSKFTKGMKRPYDPRMARAMQLTTQSMVEKTGAVIGYTQSDEISLIWYKPTFDSEMMFKSKKQKLVSVLAGLCSSLFMYNLREFGDDMDSYFEKLPHFDARVFNLPTMVEASNAILWREQDCLKNAKAMVAQHYFSHKSLHKMSGNQMVSKLKDEKNIDFYQYPTSFTHGTFVKRETIERYPTEHELSINRKLTCDSLITRSKYSLIEDRNIIEMSINDRMGFLFGNLL